MDKVKIGVRASLYAQFSPAKTLRQLIDDRNWYRTSIIAALFVFLFR